MVCKKTADMHMDCGAALYDSCVLAALSGKEIKCSKFDSIKKDIENAINAITDLPLESTFNVEDAKMILMSLCGGQ